MGEVGKIAHGSHLLQAGTDVADAGHNGGEGGSEGEVIQGHHQHGGKGDEHIGAQEDHDAVEHFLIHHPAVQLDHTHRAGVKDLSDLPAHTFEQQEDAGAFHTAAGGAGAGAAQHEDHQQGSGELRPQVKIHAGEAGGGDDGGHLKESVAQGGEVAGVEAVDVNGDEHHGGSHHREEKAQLIALERLSFPERMRK